MRQLLYCIVVHIWDTWITHTSIYIYIYISVDQTIKNKMNSFIYYDNRICNLFSVDWSTEKNRFIILLTSNKSIYIHIGTRCFETVTIKMLLRESVNISNLNNFTSEYTEINHLQPKLGLMHHIMLMRFPGIFRNVFFHGIWWISDFEQEKNACSLRSVITI